MGFPTREWDIVNFERAHNSQKKYRVYIRNKKTKEMQHMEFGAIGYQHYKDSTPVKLYSNFDHLNVHRRDLFRKRFAHQYNASEFSPLYFSWKYLW